MSSISGTANVSKSNKNSLTPYLFIAPQLILFIIFFIIPTIIGIGAAFTKWDLFSSAAPQFVGFDNFKEIFFNSTSSYYKSFWISMRNTLSFVLFSVPFCILVPLTMAIALNAKPKGYKLYQAIFYLPSVMSISSVVLAWFYMFNRNNGLINNFFKANINWLGSQPYAWMAIVIVTVWWTIGGNMVIYLAAISGVSQELLESAELDGANSLRKIVSVVIPSIKNQLLYTIILTTIAQFNIYGQPLMLTNGSPNDTTRVLLMVIRSLAFPTNGGKSISGISAAMALSLGIIIIAVSVVQYRFNKED